MSNTYTDFIDSYVKAISDDESETSTVLDALEELRSNDAYKRTFSDRFSELISEKGNLDYSPKADERKNLIPAYREYLLSLYKKRFYLMK